MYKVTLLPDAERSFKKLDQPVQLRLSVKIDWLATNAETIVHHPLTSLPDDLRGLCRLKVGDYRIIYWIYTQDRQITIYDIEHRSKNYRSIKRSRL